MPPRPPSPRRPLVRCLLATSALLLVGCSGAEDREERPDASDLQPFLDQELTFGSCEGKAPTTAEEPFFVDPFECAWLTVPLDYDDPGGATAQIGVMRLPATGDAAERIGSLVVNPGGPGGSGMVQANVVSLALEDTPVPRHFDVVGFDPRGVGASTPTIRCFTDAEQDRGENRTTLLSTSGEWDASDTQRLVDQCAERSGGEQVLAAVGTRDAARDLDVLREVLGEEQLTFAGQSYGTRLGAVYAEMFPERVRAMVLDGVIDPAQGSAERRLELQAALQDSFDAMAAFCAEQRDCPLGDDPARAVEEFQAVVQPLLDDPVPAGGGRVLDFAAATGGVISGLYDEAAWPLVLEGIAQVADEGRGDQLLAIGDAFAGRAADGEWSNQTEANLAVNCNDEERRTPEEEAALRAEIERVSPFVATGRSTEGVTRDPCEAWPAEPTLGIPYAQDVEGLPETLVVSVTGDPVTPYEAGVRLAEAWGSSLLTVRGAQHTVVQSGASDCVDDVVSAYLVELETPERDRTCRL